MQRSNVFTNASDAVHPLPALPVGRAKLAGQGRNRLMIRVVRVEGLVKKASYYAKVIVLDGTIRLKQKTKVMRTMEPKWGDDANHICFSGIESDEPNVTVALAVQAMTGNKLVGEGRLDLGQVDASGQKRVSLRLPLTPPARSGRSGLPPISPTSGIGSSGGVWARLQVQWHAPTVHTARAEARRAKAQKKVFDLILKFSMSYAAGRLQSQSRTTRSPSGRIMQLVNGTQSKNALSVPGSPSDRTGQDAKVDESPGGEPCSKSRETASEAMKKLLDGTLDFLDNVDAEIKANPEARSVLAGQMKGGLDRVIVDATLKCLDRVAEYKQSDFIRLLKFLERFDALWVGSWGGTPLKELQVMLLPLVRAFSQNCQGMLTGAIDKMIRRIFIDPPVECEDGTITTHGPRDVFSILNIHINGMVPCLQGVAALELAKFDLSLLRYCQQVLGAHLLTIRFHLRSSKEKASAAPTKSCSASRTSSIFSASDSEPTSSTTEVGTANPVPRSPSGPAPAAPKSERRGSTLTRVKEKFRAFEGKIKGRVQEISSKVKGRVQEFSSRFRGRFERLSSSVRDIVKGRKSVDAVDAVFADDCEISPDLLVGVVNSCRRFADLSETLFKRIEGCVLAPRPQCAEDGTVQGARGYKDTEIKSLVESIRGFSAAIGLGFLNAARTAASVLATYWSQLLTFDCLEPMFADSKWLAIRAAKGRKSGSDSRECSSSDTSSNDNSEEKDHPRAAAMQWCVEAINFASESLGDDWEEGVRLVATQLLSRTMDAYVQRLAASKLTQSKLPGTPKALRPGEKLKRLFRLNQKAAAAPGVVASPIYDTLVADRDYFDQAMREAHASARLEPGDLSAILEVIDATLEFFKTPDSDNRRADSCFGRFFTRLGLLAKPTMRRFVEMRRDWKLGTRREVLKRFAQYAEVLNSGGLPKRGVGDRESGAQSRSVFEINTPRLSDLRDAAWLNRWLQTMNVVYSTPCVIKRRPAIAAAVRSPSNLFSDVYVMFYDEEKGGRVSVLKVGKRLPSTGLEERTRALAAKCERDFLDLESRAVSASPPTSPSAINEGDSLVIIEGEGALHASDPYATDVVVGHVISSKSVDLSSSMRGKIQTKPTSPADEEEGVQSLEDFIVIDE